MRRRHSSRVRFNIMAVIPRKGAYANDAGTFYTRCMSSTRSSSLSTANPIDSASQAKVLAV